MSNSPDSVSEAQSRLQSAVDQSTDGACLLVAFSLTHHPMLRPVAVKCSSVEDARRFFVYEHSVGKCFAGYDRASIICLSDGDPTVVSCFYDGRWHSSSDHWWQ